MPSCNTDYLIRQVVDWADEAIGKDRHPDSTFAKLMIEEIPELANAYNKNGTLDPQEVGDVFILLFDLCYMCGVCPTDAILSKLAVNRERKWQRNRLGLMEHIDGDT